MRDRERVLRAVVVECGRRWWRMREFVQGIFLRERVPVVADVGDSRDGDPRGWLPKSERSGCAAGKTGDVLSVKIARGSRNFHA